MNKVSYGFLILCLFISCNRQVGEKKENTIVMPDEIDKGSIINISDFTKSIRLVPLETNDSILLTDIKQLFYEDGKIIIADKENNCYLFGNDGAFQARIGKRGQGPEEYLSIRSMDVVPEKDRILIQDISPKILAYTMKGEFVASYNLPELPEGCKTFNIKYIADNYYYADVVSYVNVNCRGVVFQIDNDQIQIIKRFSNHFTYSKEHPGFSLAHEKAHMYRLVDKVRTHKNINDTLFSIGKDLEIKPSFVFDFGKYKAPPELLLAQIRGKESIYIWPSHIHESSGYMFFDFFFGSHAPEPFEYIKHYADRDVVVTNCQVYGLYNKSTGELTLMNQPVKKKLGFKEDIHNLGSIWPFCISSNDEIVSFLTAEDLLESFSLSDHPSDELKQIAGKITEFDNPIVAISDPMHRF